MTDNSRVQARRHWILSKLGWIFVCLGLLLLVASPVFGYLTEEVTSLDVDQSWEGNLIGSLPFVIIFLVGGLLTSKRPDNILGWVLIAWGLTFGSLMTFAENFGNYLYYVRGYSWDSVAIYAWLAGYGWAYGAFLTGIVMYLFPTGHFQSRLWRFLGLALVYTVLFGSLFFWALPGKVSFMANLDNPYSFPGILGEFVSYLENYFIFPLIFVTVFTGIFSIGVRFLQAEGIERQQLKLFAFGAWIFGIVIISDFFLTLPGLWELIKESMTFSILPVAIGLAVLRYRLWDIDVVIRKTLVYSILTMILGVIYFGSVVLLQNFAEKVIGKGSTISIVISTLIIAWLFSPLRSRVQGLIDRRFYRKKYDAEKMLEVFSVELRGQVELEELTRKLVGFVQKSLHPVDVKLWLRPTDNREMDAKDDRDVRINR